MRGSGLGFYCVAWLRLRLCNSVGDQAQDLVECFWLCLCLLSPLVDSIKVLEQYFPLSFSVDEFNFSRRKSVLLDDRY